MKQTIKDIELIKNEEVYTTVDNDNIRINNSYLLTTPWVIYGYSFYLNHINGDTKDIIKGSSFGVGFEVFCHDIAYFFTHKSRYKDADIGGTVFNDLDGRTNDDTSNDRTYSSLMILLYLIVNPSTFIYDYSKYRGIKPWLFLMKK